MAATRKSTGRKATGRKAAPRKAADTTPEDRTADTVTVKVRPPHAVYWNGEQRGGTIRNVDRQTAEDWRKQGWCEIT